MDAHTLAAGLSAAFPSPASYAAFEQDARDIAPRAPERLRSEAARAGLIPAASDTDFRAFLEREGHGVSSEGERRSFATILEMLLEGRSVNAVLAWLEHATEPLGLPPVSAAMVTRLRSHFKPNTPRKRLALRALAFWVGACRPSSIVSYEDLLRLPRTGNRPAARRRESHGITIGFQIRGRAVSLPPQSVDWLQASLSRSLADLGCATGARGDVRTQHLGVSSLGVMLPKQQGHRDELALYATGIRDAMGLAHHVLVHWFLSPYCGQGSQLTVAVAAGDFSAEALKVSLLLEKPIGRQYEVLLTDGALLCARVADVRAGFEQIDRGQGVAGGRAETLWRVHHFWSYAYFDIVADLLQDENLPNTADSYRRFQAELFASEAPGETTFGALQAIRRSPQSAFLQVEAAKVCLGRLMLPEANMLLGYALRTEPRHIVARVLRMMFFLNQAVIANDESVADAAFDRALAEGDYVLSYADDDEEVLCEAGLVHLSCAFRRLRRLRAYPSSDSEIEKALSPVRQSLEQARGLFERGTVVSASGSDNRCLFWLCYTVALLAYLLGESRSCLTDRNSPPHDERGVFKQTLIRLFAVQGWIPSTADVFSTERRYRTLPDAIAEGLNQVVLGRMAVYESSVLSRTYLPNILYALSCFAWDCLPRPTVGLCKQVIRWLTQAHSLALRLADEGLAVYSFATCYSYMQHPRAFAQCVASSLGRIHELVPADILAHDDTVFLDRLLTGDQLDAKDALIIMLHNIDTPLDSTALFSGSQ